MKSFGVSIFSVLIVMGMTSGYAELETIGGEWEQMPDMPTPRTEVDGVTYDGVIYVVGGFSSGRTTSTAIEAYHVEDSRWETLPEMPQPSNHPAVTAGNGKIYVVGGEVVGDRGDDNHIALDNVEVYDIERETWLLGPDLPYTIHAQASGEHDGFVYVIGGSTEAWVASYDTLTGNTFVLDTNR